ncbi:MAG: hypothetical protein KDI48_07615, partial [Xanthomonadales bacterium]|nr:hypothetical protein [Xanthomonadales bacterium]
MRMIRRRWIGLGLLALIGLLLAWVLLSTAALRLVLRQVPGLSSEAEAGRLVGPIELGVLRWSDGAMRVEADGVHLAHRFMPLFGGELVVQTLVVERLRIVLPPAVDPPPPATPPSEWRLDLPALDLPGDLQLDGLEVQQVEVLSADEELLLQGQLSAQDLSIVGGRIRIGQLQAQAESIGSVQLSADLDSGDRWSGELKAQAELTSADIRTVELSLNGGLDRYELQLDAQGALQVQGRIELSALTQAPGWQLRLEGQRAATAEAEDLRFDLSGEGERGIGTISGELQQGEQQLQLQSVQIRLDDDQMLRVPAAQLSASGPLSLTASAKGQWPLDESAPAGELRLSWQDLVLADAESPLRSDQGELQLSGRPEAYTLSLRAAIARAGQAPTPDAIGDLQLQAQGDLQQLQSLVATLESNFGRIEIDGQVQFEPLHADLALQTSGLDTGVLLPELPGELGLRGRAKLARAEEQLSAELEIEQLSGQLRDAPLQGEGHLAWVDAELPSGRLRLSWGDNEIGYQRPTGESGQLLLQIDQPGLLLADLQGSVRGQLMLPALLERWRQASGELKVRSLSLDQLSVEQISLQRAAGTDQPLSLQLEGLQAAGQRLDTASAQLQPGERWTLQLDASGPDMNLTLGASAGVEEGTWSGQLRDLQFAHGDYPAVALDSATGWRWSENGGGGLEDSCLSVREGRICLQLSHAPDSGLSLEGRFEALQLAWLEPLWIDTPARLQGALSGDVQGRWDLDRRLVVDGELQIPQLQLSLPSPDGGERIERTAALQLRLGDGQAQADAEPTGQHAELQLDLADQGALQVVVDGDALAADPTWT